MIDIENFFDNYISTLSTTLDSKQKILENFKKVEDKLKLYREALTEIEKLKNEIRFDLMEDESKNFLAVLLDFDPDNMDDNINVAYSAAEHLKELGHDLKKTTEDFLQTKTFWSNFKKANLTDIKEMPRFVNDIEKELSTISESLKTSSIEDLQRINDKINETKIQINRSIALLNDLRLLIETNFFFGKDAMMLFEKIDNFLQTKYLTAPLAELSDFYKEVEEEKQEIQKKNKVEKKALPLYKAQSKTSGPAASFAVLAPDRTFINLTEVAIDSPKYIDLERFIYIENFPLKGIFSKKFLLSSIEVSEDEIAAGYEFDAVSLRNFLTYSGLSLFVIMVGLAGFLGLFQVFLLVLLFALLFVFNFSRLKTKIDKKYEVPEAFYFNEVNFYVVKEGSFALKPKKVVPLILVNLEKFTKFKSAADRAKNISYEQKEEK